MLKFTERPKTRHTIKPGTLGHGRTERRTLAEQRNTTGTRNARGMTEQRRNNGTPPERQNNTGTTEHHRNNRTPPEQPKHHGTAEHCNLVPSASLGTMVQSTTIEHWRNNETMKQR